VLALLKRYRELFAIGILLVLPFITYLAYSKQDRSLNRVDRAVLFVTTPIERALSSTVDWALATWHGYVALRGVRQENLELRSENLRLKDTVTRLNEAKAENERLREMLNFAGESPSTLLPASVVGVGPTMNLLTLKIGKGSAEGVGRGMAVVAAGGIVGRVLNASAHSADVLLVADAKFAVPVRVQRSRTRAMVVGQGELSKLSLNQALRTDDIKEQDDLVTSGTDGVFPKGLKVGTVKNLVQPHSGMFQSAEVVPAVDIAHVEEVFVIRPEREDITEAVLPQK
jgi:rod shape-determining protein MreC